MAKIPIAAAAAAASLTLLVHAVAGTVALGGERRFLFANETRKPIVELHVAAVGSGNWQDDLLGWDHLRPGAAVFVDIDDRKADCRVDIKMVLDDGSELVSRNIDVCREAVHALSQR
jgi:hypothetical protein